METSWCWILIITVAISIWLHRFRGSAIMSNIIGKSVLILTAHPDDECMFFGPTICSLSSVGVPIHILCLSTGDYYGLGETRISEFYKSVSLLGVQSERAHIVNDYTLPDSQTIFWNTSDILGHLSDIIKKHNIDVVITFDSGGVSGHPNHISLFQALRNNPFPSLTVYKLKTVSIFRKYSSIVDLFISNMLKENIFVTPADKLFMPFLAMFAHSSQLVWFRYLYIAFSRYMIMNSLESINEQ